MTTDTVCGIGAFVKDDLEQTLNRLKGRAQDQKIIILVGSIAQAETFAVWNKKATNWAKKHWPGARSIIVNGVGFRMPDCPKLCEFFLANGAMHVTSANKTKELPLSFEAAKKKFPQVKKYLNYCTPNGKPSSIFVLETKTYLRN
ncbi:Sua5/YciO/YrdC/YwlC family protein [Mycoplasmopsis equigenitalium]|uniref:L-threonylcarbamoyladenylate synthase n=1 Tax=Mycoplasmopsis equigenitalium TaxID=114883 RepID=A0ABY5J1T3_9BACT|nr:Sua5/YciO/YrdC/YwlC family protein [Mycoplasmopsis equigenitalium]UUD37212.1 Sua5/YciO/YrdC/YwlC family protein [Mycoplasmopsis equigenitalium]